MLRFKQAVEMLRKTCIDKGVMNLNIVVTLVDLLKAEWGCFRRDMTMDSKTNLRFLNCRRFMNIKPLHYSAIFQDDSNHYLHFNQITGER